MSVKKSELLSSVYVTHSTEIESGESQTNHRKSKTIHELFHSDTLEIGENTDSLKATEQVSYQCFFSKAMNIQSTHTPSDEDIRRAAPIHPIPEIDKPAFFQEASLEGFVPKITSHSQISNLPSKDLLRNLAQMESKTIDQVMAIVLKAQLELERDQAEISQNSFDQLQNLRKIQERTLEEIKEALKKDEKLAGYLDTAQKIAIAATFICGVAAMVITLSFSMPILTGAATALAIPAKMGAFFTGLLTAFSAGGKGYINAKSNQTKGVLTSHKHDIELTKGWTDDYREKMGTIAETDAYFKEMLIKLIKSLERMRRNVSAT
ncbi:hypothetical protein [Candidatus Protochlamydia amoebophila]|uniref:Uncharacterized protein n=1 Tax=Protochlamydia amoebophila (strain UWE25) TaxID=264201 RepID=Q6MC64_PARUW|nr:hypothetical protein [Candidatus Protochlamydia amoebophila]CAF23835.1 unnamed protein product [Candidatus Protochlamydia amoebophila UWE25]